MNQQRPAVLGTRFLKTGRRAMVSLTPLSIGRKRRDAKSRFDSVSRCRGGRANELVRKMLAGCWRRSAQVC